MRSTVAAVLAVAALTLALAAPPAAAQRFDLGVRGAILAADGEPANDIPGYGLFGHARLGDRWNLGFGVDTAEYVFRDVS